MATLEFNGLVYATIGNTGGFDALRFGPTAFFDGSSGLVTLSGFSYIYGSIVGTSGDDSIELTFGGVASSASIRGGAGNDRITVNNPGFSVYGEDGNDTLIDYSYSPGVTILDGGDGNDRFYFNRSETVVIGGNGDDSVYVGIEIPEYSIDGGSGHDTIIFGSGLSDVTAFTSQSKPINGLDSFEEMHGYIMPAGDGAVIDLRGFVGTGELYYYGYSYYPREVDAIVFLGSEDDTVYGFGRHLETGGGKDSVIGAIRSAGYCDGGSGIDELYLEGGAAVSNLDQLVIKNFETVAISGLDGTSNADRIDLSRFDVTQGYIIAALGAGNDYFKAGEFYATVDGGDGHDTLVGSNLSDGLAGGAGNDVLIGGAERDWLDGGEGNDRLEGGVDADEMHGGTGNDTFVIDNSGDQIIELAGEGIDTMKSSVVDLTLAANVEKGLVIGLLDLDITGNELANTITGNASANVLSGGEGKDLLNGNDGQDSLFGDGGNDTLNGGNGNDSLSGGAGIDLLTGGAGVDILTGGSEADQFKFDKFMLADGLSATDTITDFSGIGGDRDRINLSAIDANGNAGDGNQKFGFIGAAAFGGVAGQLRYEQVGGVTRVLGDTDGDGIADFQIEAVGTINFSSGDFFL